MAQSYRSRHLRVMRRNEEQMTALFAGLARYGAARIVRAADSEGNIPRSATYDLQRDIGDRIVRMFLGRNREGQMAAYEVLPDGAVMPLSSYMRILWSSITDAIRIELEREAALMDRLLPDDIKTWLAVQTGIVREQEVIDLDALADYWRTWRTARDPQNVFAPNPLADYDQPHLWVDPNGYRLSDRIWRTAGATRRKVDAFLEEGIAQGRGALSLSKDLERFLHPGRQIVRTRTPYGTDASYDAMRLARTEISRGAAQAHEAAAKANPFVEKLRWKLSPQHPCCDICDTYADKEYELDNLPTQPAHPHCMCYWESVVDTDKRREVLDQAREEIRAARRAMMGGREPREEATTESSSTPAGTPVSKGLKTPKSGKYKDVYGRVTQAIDNTHGDGELPELPVKTVSQKQSARMGAFDVTYYRPTSSHGGPPPKATGIRVNSAGENMELTFLHEVGHYLDFQTMDGINFASQKATAEGQLMNEWAKAVKNSDAIQTLLDKYNNPGKYEIQIALKPGQLVYGYDSRPDKQHLRYLLNNKEVWARSYTQYVAEKSGDPVLLEQLGKELQDKMYGERHWSAEDFKPIRKAIDGMFASMGWIG